MPQMLESRVQLLWRLDILFKAVLPSVLIPFAVFFTNISDSSLLLAACVLTPWILALVLAFRLPARRWNAWSYRITSDSLRLNRGVLVRRESVIPFTRIQHVDTEQGPLERMLSLSRVTVHTASGSGGSLTIPGLKPDRASALREQLAELAGAVEPL